MAKEKILEAAMDLFIHQGYHATSISDVAKQAGISKGRSITIFQARKDCLPLWSRSESQALPKS